MLLAISDASVLVDLAAVSLLEPMTRLPLQFIVPDLVVNEITRIEQREAIDAVLRDGKITVVLADVTDLEMIATVFQEQRALSFADCAVLVLAGKHRAMILTNDSRLRQLASRKSLACHGTLWVVRRLVQESIVTHSLAKDALVRLISANPRLPKAECEKLLRELEDPT